MTDLRSRNLVRDLGEVHPSQLARQRRALVEALEEAPVPPRRSRLRLGLVAAGAVAAAAVAVLVLARPTTSPTAPQTAFWVADQAAREGAEVDATTPVEVRFAEGSRLAWAEGSGGAVTRASAGSVSIALRRGRLAAAIVPTRTTGVRWQFEAGGYVARVVGTQFVLGLDADAFELTVTEGEVLVTGPGAERGVSVTAGHRLRAAAAGLAVTPLSELEPPAALDAGEPASVAEGPAAVRRPPRRAPQGPQEWKVLAGEHQYEEALEAAEALDFPLLVQRLGPEDLALLADVARFARSAPRAKEALGQLARRFPRHPRGQLVPFMLGRLAFDVERDPAAAARAFRAYLDGKPTGALVEEAQGRLMEALRDSGAAAAAATEARRYLERYPDGVYAKLARSLTSPEPR